MADRFEIHPKTLRWLNWQDAVSQELGANRTLLPPSPMRKVLKEHAGDYGDFVAASVARGLVSPTTSLISPKADHGLRTLTVMSLDLTVLYHALVGRVRSLLPAPRTDEYQQVMESPLAQASTTHVLSADISAFYQYVDHGVVSQELIAWTGDGDVASGVFEFLSHVSGRLFGLPQVHAVSDLLAELLLDRIDRKLTRKGYAVQHYSDDFRVACTSRTQAWEAWVGLNEEANNIGLSLNDSKTNIRSIDDYSQYLRAPDGRWNDLAGVVSDTFSGLNPYTDEWVQMELDDRDVLEGTAREALALWEANTAEPGSLLPLDSLVYRRVMIKALQFATALGSDAALPHLHAIVTRVPYETRAVSRYLQKFDPEVKARALESLVSQLETEKDYILPWQSLWLLDAARPANDYELPQDILSPSTFTWLLRMTEAANVDVVRARAIMVLSLYGIMEPAEVAASIDDLHPSTRDVLVSAVALQVEDSRDRLVRSVVDGYQPYQWLVDHLVAARETASQDAALGDVPW